MKRERSEYEESIKNLDIVKCLMILSRTSIVKQIGVNQFTERNTSNRFECKTCNRRFSSFQALGGHRASHKKPKLTVDEKDVKHLTKNYKGTHMHKCSRCGQSFGTGQALGGDIKKFSFCCILKSLNSLCTNKISVFVGSDVVGSIWMDDKKHRKKIYTQTQQQTETGADTNRDRYPEASTKSTYCLPQKNEPSSTESQNPVILASPMNPLFKIMTRLRTAYRRLPRYTSLEDQSLQRTTKQGIVKKKSPMCGSKYKQPLKRHRQPPFKPLALPTRDRLNSSTNPPAYSSPHPTNMVMKTTEAHNNKGQNPVMDGPSRTEREPTKTLIFMKDSPIALYVGCV
ncbi:unnamed protein product [Brassica oleracea]